MNFKAYIKELMPSIKAGMIAGVVIWIVWIIGAEVIEILIK